MFSASCSMNTCSSCCRYSCLTRLGHGNGRRFMQLLARSLRHQPCVYHSALLYSTVLYSTSYRRKMPLTSDVLIGCVHLLVCMHQPWELQKVSKSWGTN